MTSAKTCGTSGAGTVSKKAGIEIIAAYRAPSVSSDDAQLSVPCAPSVGLAQRPGQRSWVLCAVSPSSCRSEGGGFLCAHDPTSGPLRRLAVLPVVPRPDGLVLWCRCRAGDPGWQWRHRLRGSSHLSSAAKMCHSELQWRTWVPPDPRHMLGVRAPRSVGGRWSVTTQPYGREEPVPV